MDDFLLDNYEMLNSFLAHASMGAGAVSDGWSRHLDAIKETLGQIEQLHRDYLGAARSKRVMNFMPSGWFCSLGWRSSWIG